MSAKPPFTLEAYDLQIFDLADIAKIFAQYTKISDVILHRKPIKPSLQVKYQNFTRNVDRVPMFKLRSLNLVDAVPRLLGNGCKI